MLEHSFVRLIKALIYRERYAAARRLARSVFPCLRESAIAARVDELRGVRRTLYVFDPGLSDGSGHHLNFNVAVREQAEGREGLGSVFVGRVDIVEPLRTRLGGLPFFVKGAFPSGAGRSSAEGVAFQERKRREKPKQSPCWNAFTASLFEGFDPGPEDVLMFHSITRDVAAAIGRFIGSLGRPAPRIVVAFMTVDYPGDDGSGLNREYAELVAAIARCDPQRTVVLAETTEICQDFRARSGARVDVELAPHFKPEGTMRELRTQRFAAPPKARPVVGYLGHARFDRGSYLVPAIVAELRRRAPERFDYRVHVQNPEARAMDTSSLEDLPDVELRVGHLPIETYYRLFIGVDIMMFPYQPGERSEKMGSGLFWECVATGATTVVPAGSNMEVEAERLGCPFVSFDGLDATAVAAAVCEATERSGELRERGRLSSGRYADENPLSVFAERVLGPARPG